MWNLSCVVLAALLLRNAAHVQASRYSTKWGIVNGGGEHFEIVVLSSANESDLRSILEEGGADSVLPGSSWGEGLVRKLLQDKIKGSADDVSTTKPSEKSPNPEPEPELELELEPPQDCGSPAKCEEVNEELLDAAEEGYFGGVKEALSKGAEVDARDSVEWTPLMIAAQEGFLDIVEYLISKGADVNATNAEGNTPLHVASEYGDLEVVPVLIDSGADINAKNAIGDTPLHLASREGNLDLVKALIDSGADVNAKTDNGETPLHLASWNSHLEVVQELIDSGADKGVETILGQTAEDIICGNWNNCPDEEIKKLKTLLG